VQIQIAGQGSIKKSNKTKFKSEDLTSVQVTIKKESVLNFERLASQFHIFAIPQNHTITTSSTIFTISYFI
jgi:hypothetical protein